MLLDCRVVRFDYNVVKGTMWIAKDEFGYFLFKEEAKAKEGAFQLIMDEYRKETISLNKSDPHKENTGKDEFGF